MLRPSVCFKAAENGADDSSTLVFRRCLFSGSEGTHSIGLAASDYRWVFPSRFVHILSPRESSRVSDIENVFRNPALVILSWDLSFSIWCREKYCISTKTNQPFKKKNG